MFLKISQHEILTISAIQNFVDIVHIKFCLILEPLIIKDFRGKEIFGTVLEMVEIRIRLFTKIHLS